MILRPILLIASLLCLLPVGAVENPGNPTDTIKHRGFVTRLLDYFNDANKEKKDKRFDFSIIG